MAAPSRQRVGISEAGLWDPALPSNTQSHTATGEAALEQKEPGTACRLARLVWLGDFNLALHGANVVQGWYFAHDLDSGMVEQSVYTINMGAFKLRAH